MGRKYELKRRAEQVEETRRRILEAAIELHELHGPARTSVSAVAERAGVQRQTYYRHFPGERSLFKACTGLYMEQNPLPDPARWRAVDDGWQRLRLGLAELYDYFADHEQMLAGVTRDAEVDPLTREMVDAFVVPVVQELHQALADGLAVALDGERVSAALGLALDFNAWRSLHRAGLSDEGAVDLMVTVLRCLASTDGARP